MRTFINILFIVIMFMSTSLFSCKQDKPKEYPNILIILVDDMGFSDIGSYGGEVNTPNIDKLAYEGLRFSRFYNTAKCFPSRACLLTGQYAQHCGMSKKGSTFTNAVTIAEVLHEAGYRTLMVGKHHGEENPVNFGFDRYFGLRDGTCNYFNPGIQREGEPVPAREKNKRIRTWAIDSVIYEPYTPKEKDFYTTDYFTNYAIDYLDEYKNEDKPFFMYLAFTAPHDPLMAWPEDINKYIGKYMAGYEAIRKKRYERLKQMGLIDVTFPLSEPTYDDWDSLSETDKINRDSIMATYAAMIDRIDQNIGRLLLKVEELGELENTLILFMSDNGAQSRVDERDEKYSEAEYFQILSSKVVSDSSLPIGNMGRWTSLTTSWANVSNTPFRLYKEKSHEGGISTPLIISLPKYFKNNKRIINYPSHLIDIMPTILEITGTSYPDEFKNGKVNPYDGVSLLPLIKGIEPKRETPIFWEWRNGKAIRKGKWKLVSDDNGPWELYDMTIDQTETNDLVEKFPEIVEGLIADWENWINESIKSN